MIESNLEKPCAGTNYAHPLKTKCPDCKNGEHFIFPHQNKDGKIICSVKCPVCDGTGTLPDNIKYNPEAGLILKQQRIFKAKTLRQFCLDNHLDVQIRSEKERGFFREEATPTLGVSGFCDE